MNSIKLFTLCILAISALTLTGCKKDKNEDTRKVEYKVVSSPQTLITTITFTDVNGNDKTVSGDNKSEWSSGELQIPNSVTTLKISSTAPGATGLSLKVQILVDGVVKKEETKIATNNSGNMDASATY